jgi:hypothetical protein
MNLTGQLTPVSKGASPRWDSQLGWSSEETYEGTRDALQTLADDLIAAGGLQSLRFDQIGGPLWRLVVQYPARDAASAQEPVTPNDLISTSYSFPRNDLQRSLWEHPAIEAEIAKIDLAYRAKWRADVEAWARGETSATDAISGQPYELSGDALISVGTGLGMNPAVTTPFLSDLASGVDAYVLSQQVLRVVRSGPTASDLRLANENVNRVYTRDRMLAEINPPDWVTAKSAPGYWFKRSPEENQEGNRLVITLEYEHIGTRYSTFAYGPPIG